MKLKCKHNVEAGDVLISDIFITEILEAGGKIEVIPFKGGYAFKILSVPDRKPRWNRAEKREAALAREVFKTS